METFYNCPLCNFMDDIVFRVFIEGKRQRCCIQCLEEHRAETEAYVNSWQQRKAIPRPTQPRRQRGVSYIPEKESKILPTGSILAGPNGPSKK